MTRMLSAERIVDRRWAMTKQVLPFISSRIAAWISCSVRVSTFEVASSRISMFASSSIALAIVISCFCPFEMPEPLSVSTVL